MSKSLAGNHLFISVAENTDSWKKANKKFLVNVLNYVNFQEKTIFLNFKHSKNDDRISVPVKPQPCMGDKLDCTWTENNRISDRLKLYEFVDMFVPKGKKLILVKPELKDINKEKISFKLPETCQEFTLRKAARHSCKGIRVEFVQHGTIFHGALIDFSPASFRVEISAVPPQTFQWINPGHSVNILLKNEHDLVFTGECMIIKQSISQKTGTFVLSPVKDNISRFKSKEIRSIRQKLLPSPHIVFVHPIIKKVINLEVDDMSGSGLSVEESLENSVLLPGMIISDMEIEFAAGFKINCMAQVVYRKMEDTNDETVLKCGIAFLDMDIRDQTKLSSILHHVSDKKSYVSTKVDLDELWQFFFEAGFIYPKKYAHIHANREEFKKTYKKLYYQNPYVAKYFVYLEKGEIKGHISMLHIFENAWLFHHHASSSIRSKAGLAVLDQISRYVNDFYQLQSTNMSFIISYFRAENRFPSRVFGGFARSVNDPKGCSIDSFAYFSLLKNFESWNPDEIKLENAKKEDLLELKAFYEHRSGGLMTQALDLEPDMIGCNNLSTEYAKAGLKREKYVFSLKRDELLKAVFIVTVSDFGLNLSNATNCIHAIVMDEENTPPGDIVSALSVLSRHYEQNDIPVFIYPVSYAQDQNLPYEKIYNMWILSIVQKGELFLKYSKRLSPSTGN